MSCHMPTLPSLGEGDPVFGHKGGKGVDGMLGGSVPGWLNRLIASALSAFLEAVQIIAGRTEEAGRGDAGNSEEDRAHARSGRIRGK